MGGYTIIIYHTLELSQCEEKGSSSWKLKIGPKKFVAIEWSFLMVFSEPSMTEMSSSDLNTF